MQIEHLIKIDDRTGQTWIDGIEFAVRDRNQQILLRNAVKLAESMLWCLNVELAEADEACFYSHPGGLHRAEMQTLPD